MSESTLTLQGALAKLPASHRRLVAKEVGAEGDAPAAIAAVLSDEEGLAAIVGGLSADAQAACTELAFAAVAVQQAPGGEPVSRRAVDELERNGLALCFENAWSLAVIVPRDLVPLLRRVRARAHARRIPDAPAPAAEGTLAERLLHDVAAVGARIAHRGIQVKADGELFTKARPKLAAALPQLADDEIDLGERDPDAILARLRRLAGELPQNVERSLAGWVSQAPPQARLRSAILVDLGDQRAEIGDLLADRLGELLAERLAPGLLAMSGDRLDAVATVLRTAGVALEPGLQAVSGAWPRSFAAPQQHVASWWRPNPTAGERAAPPPGRLVSALEDEQGPGSAILQKAAEAIDRLQRADQPPEPAELEGDLLKRLAVYLETLGDGDPKVAFLREVASRLEPEDLFEDEPRDAEYALEEACEHGSKVELRYAGANGTVVERVRVADIDEARVLVENLDAGEQSWRWLKSILDVTPLDD